MILMQSDHPKVVEKGDGIYYKGKTYFIDNIIDQFDAGKEGMMIEFIDVAGFHRSWKQYQDGGNLVGYKDWTLMHFYLEKDNIEAVEWNELVTLTHEPTDEEILEFLYMMNYIRDKRAVRIICSERCIRVISKETGTPIGILFPK